MIKMRGRCKSVILFFLLLIIANCYIIGETPAGPSAPGEELESVILHFRWHHQFQFAGYYAAVKKGFYRQAGLKVTLVERIPGKDVIKIVAGAPGRYGVSNSEVLLHRLQGKPLVVLAAIFQHSPAIIITRKESGISTPQHLIGKRVMMENKYKNAELWATLHMEGVSPHLVNMVKGNYTLEDYLDKTFDGVSAYITDQPYIFKHRGIEIHCIQPSMYGIDFYGDCLFTSEQELKKYPGRVKAFREASLKGWEYAMKNPDEIIDIIVKEYGTTHTSSHLRYEAREMHKLILPDIVEIGHMNPGRWQHIADTFVRLKMAEPNYSLEGFIYDPHAEKSYAWVKWVIGITLFLALMGGLGVITLFFFNKHLQKEVAVRRQTEEKLRTANEQAMAATRAKSEFLAKMSHEIRTPMNGVIGMAGLLGNTPLNPEQKEYVEAIQVSGNNLLRVIDNILDFTKIEAGKMDIQEEIFAIESCIREVFKIFSQNAAEKDIRLHYSIAPGVHPFIKTDMARLKQVLINLLNNAMKFMEDGEILVSVTSISSKNNAVVLKFSVKDEGIGIPADKIETLFDAFSQVDSSSSRKYGGTGLGLAISKQLVELLGGSIKVTSKPGVGSTFTFTIHATISSADAYNEEEARKSENLPPGDRQNQQKDSAPGADAQRAEPGINREPLHILVAEDNKINQKLVLRLLTKMGYRVDVADNGIEVLKALEQKYYPIILMDIQMPEMDGVEATRLITEQYSPDKRPKIIALTANVIRGDREKYLEMGMDDYISKPINVPQLKQTMNKWSHLLAPS